MPELDDFVNHLLDESWSDSDFREVFIATFISSWLADVYDPAGNPQLQALFLLRRLKLYGMTIERRVTVDG